MKRWLWLFLTSKGFFSYNVCTFHSLWQNQPVLYTFKAQVVVYAFALCDIWYGWSPYCRLCWSATRSGVGGIVWSVALNNPSFLCGTLGFRQLTWASVGNTYVWLGGVFIDRGMLTFIASALILCPCSISSPFCDNMSFPDGGLWLELVTVPCSSCKPLCFLELSSCAAIHLGLEKCTFFSITGIVLHQDYV